jgi:hypothetical protein
LEFRKAVQGLPQYQKPTSASTQEVPRLIVTPAAEPL